MIIFAVKSAHFQQQTPVSNEKTLTFQVSAYDLASFNETAAAWETAAGTYQLQFGASVADIRATASCKIKAQSWPVKAIW